MSDPRDFRRSGNIEDRRKQKHRPEPGVFGDGNVPNVFDAAHGLLTGLGRNDFHPQEGPISQLQRDVGVEDLPAVNGPVAAAAPMPLMGSPQSSLTSTQAAIVRAAQEDGIDPAYALAVAERESRFNPRARSSKTIRGIYQMRGDLRTKYGSGDSDDPYEQAKGWGRFIPDVKRDMGGVLGRDATDPESYLGHHFGARRAARMLKMDPSTRVEALFTPQEMGLNPHFARAGTVGNLNGSVMADIGKRMARFGGAMPPSPEPADLSSFGEPTDTVQPLRSGTGQQNQAVSNFPNSSESSSAPDLASFGTPVDQPAPLRKASQVNPERLPSSDAASGGAGLLDLSSYGTLAA